MRIQLVLVLAVVLFLFSCGGRALAPLGAGSSNTGETAFAQHCLSCHAVPATLSGSTHDDIVAALHSVPAMQPIQLSVDDLNNIVVYLATVEPIHTPDPVEGQAIWDSTCTSCHSNPSGFAGFSVTHLEQSVSNPPMNGISLTPDQFEDVASYLATFLGPGNASNGQTLWTSNCSSCHADASVFADFTTVEVQLALTHPPMDSITLSASGYNDIAAYLATLTPTADATDGQTLYNTICSTCHAPSELSGRTAADIEDALLSVAPMSGLSITPQQTQDLAAYFKTI